MDSTKRVDPSLALATTVEKADPIYVGNDLHVDLWVRPSMGTPKSILIRSVDVNGEMRSSLIHVAQDVRVIPNYTAGVALAEPNTSNPNSNTKKIKVKKKLFRKISEFAFALVVLSFLAAFLTGALQGRVVLTGSMKPEINPGDLLITKSMKFSEPQVGDVVIYSARDLQGQAVSTWAHRIIEGNSSDGFILKGDANPAPDIGTVKLSDVESVVLFTIPAIGKFMNPLVVILLGSGLLMLIFALSMWRRTSYA